MSANTKRDAGGLPRELRDRLDEGRQLRALAHALASAPDTASLLRILAESAMVLCGAEGATVIRMHEATDDAEIVAAAGSAAAYQGLWYPIGNSLTGRAARERIMISHPDYSTYVNPPQIVGALQETQPDFIIGPLTVAPLVAHDEVLGVLTIMRRVGQTPFTIHEERRLEVMTDYASLALQKAALAEAAETASQARNKFLTTISHELRTPLTALTGYGELLSDDILGVLTPLQRDTVERMRAVTNHLAVMIDEILTFASIDAGRERVVLTPVSPARVVRAAVSIVEPLVRKKTVELVVSSSDIVLPLQSDEEKIRQILVNLAENAAKFTEAGVIRLSVVDTGFDVRFIVEDTGIGIAESELPRLFQPFTQVDAGLTRRYGGSGLGLYISSRLAALLGGRIDVTSAPGVGSTFTLSLPRGATAEAGSE